MIRKPLHRNLCGLLLGSLLLTQCDKIPKLGASAEVEADGETAVVRDLDPTEFDAFISIKDRLVVVDFHADWCGPCKSLGPKLKSVAEEFDGRVVVGKVNVDNAQNLAARLGVDGIPDVRVFRNGAQVDRFVGDIPEAEVRSKMEAQVTLLPAEGTEAAGNQPSTEPIQPMTKDWIPEGMQKR
jgi:thioredoxin